jgi:putative ABC transport system permease protein
MTAIAWGFEKSWSRTYTARGTDLAVAKTSSKTPMGSIFDEAIIHELQGLPGVLAATGLLTDFMGIEESPGYDRLWLGPPTDFSGSISKLVEGRWPQRDEKAVVLGTIAAELLGKKPGSAIQLDVSEFTVCGIYESSALVENGAVVMNLPQMQKLSDKDGKIQFHQSPSPS